MKLDTVDTQRETRHSDRLSDLPLEQPEPDVLDLFLVLAKHKKKILGSVVVSLVLALGLILLLPTHYTSTAMILPPQQTQSTASMLMSQLTGAAGLGSLAAIAGKDLGLKNPNDIYIGMLKSRTVQDGLIQQFNLQQVYRDKKLSQARKDLVSATDISTDKNGLIEIAVDDKDPKRAADLANAYVSGLHKLTQSLAITEASQRRLFFQQELEQSKENLSEAEVALKQTEQKTGMIHLDSQAKAIIDAVGKLQAQIAAKDVELRAMRLYATSENPALIIAEQQLAGLQDELAKLEQQQNVSPGDPVVATGKIPEYGLEYARKLRDVKYRETIFELMAKQFEAAKLDESKEAAIIQVVDPAIVPDHRSFPRPTIIFPVLFSLGAIFGVLWALASEGWSRMLQNDQTHMRVLKLKGYLGMKRSH